MENGATTRICWPQNSYSNFNPMKLLIAICLLETTLQAGTISGSVHARGKEGTASQGGEDKYASRKYKFVERINYDELHDFIVYIDQPTAVKPLPPDKPIQVITTNKVTQQ